MPRRLASTTTFAGEPTDDPLQSVRIDLIERGTPLGVDVEDGDQRARAVDDRNDDLRLRARVTGDVTGEARHVRNHDRATFRGSRSAHAFAERDFQTSQRSLIRTD